MQLLKYGMVIALAGATSGGHFLWHKTQRAGSLPYARTASSPMALSARTSNGFRVESGETITVNYRVTSRAGKILICLNRRRPEGNRPYDAGGTLRYVNVDRAGTLSTVAPQAGIYEITLGAPLSDFQGEAEASWQVS